MIDFYKGCVAEVLGIPVESVTDTQRELAKQLTFGARMHVTFAPRTDEEVRRDVLGVLAGMRRSLAAAGGT